VRISLCVTYLTVVNEGPEEFIRVLLPRRQPQCAQTNLAASQHYREDRKASKPEEELRRGRDCGAFVQVRCCQELAVANLYRCG